MTELAVPLFHEVVQHSQLSRVSPVIRFRTDITMQFVVWKALYLIKYPLWKLVLILRNKAKEKCRMVYDLPQRSDNLKQVVFLFFKTLLWVKLCQDFIGKSKVKLLLVFGLLTHYNKFVPVWQVALRLHLLFGSSQDVPLNQLTQLLCALLWGFLLNKSCTLIASLYDNLTKLVGEEVQIS